MTIALRLVERIASILDRFILISWIAIPENKCAATLFLARFSLKAPTENRVIARDCNARARLSRDDVLVIYKIKDPRRLTTFNNVLHLS